MKLEFSIADATISDVVSMRKVARFSHIQEQSDTSENMLWSGRIWSLSTAQRMTLLTTKNQQQCSTWAMARYLAHQKSPLKTGFCFLDQNWVRNKSSDYCCCHDSLEDHYFLITMLCLHRMLCLRTAWRRRSWTASRRATSQCASWRTSCRTSSRWAPWGRSWAWFQALLTTWCQRCAVLTAYGIALLSPGPCLQPGHHCAQALPLLPISYTAVK